VKKFIVLYHAPASAREQMARATPEQAKAGMEAWMSWAKRAGDAVVDLGMPLGNGRDVKSSGTGNSTATVAGYSILQADSMDAITRLLKDHPHLRQPSASIEVFESLPLPGM
jgi:hypothetical protein